MTGLSFKSLLMSISDQLKSEDLDRMKFGLDLPQGKLEDVHKPYELFQKMINAKLLSEENRDHLASLLQFAGRIDLSKELLQDIHDQVKSTTEQEISSFFDGQDNALPCRPPHFYGRDETLDEIVGILSENDGRRLVVITGPPGYGKSCLARAIGHTMLEKEFQVIFLSLREIKSVDKMSTNILLALNVSQGVANRQRDLALSHLSSLTTKTILILDNAEDLINQPDTKQKFGSFVDHVIMYAKNVQCVIASRVSCPASCQTLRHPVELGALENDAAAKLLQAKVQENSKLTLEDAEASTIANLCLNIPLILHAAAAYLEVVNPQTLIQILEENFTAPLDLADMDDLSPDFKMKRFLKDCLQQLGQELEEALISLAVFPAAFSYEQAACVYGSHQLHSTLMQLVKRSLVHSNVTSKTFVVHRVIQLCCEEKAEKDERLCACYSNARQRFIEHYLSLITELHRGFLSKDDSKKTLCRYFAEEQHIIQAIWWAAKSGTALATRCAEILNQAVIFLCKVMKKSEFEKLYEVVLNCCQGDLRIVADCLTCVGINQIYSCECHRTCDVVSEWGYRILQRALGNYEQLNLTEGDLVAQCNSKIARCMAMNGNPITALKLSAKALAICEKKKEEEPLQYAACCNDRAVVQSSLNNHEEALSLRERALSACVDQLDDHPLTGTLYNYLGNDCLALGNFDKAVEYFSKALSIRNEFLGFYHQKTSRTLHDLGVAYKMKGDYVNAMEKLNSAVVIQEALFDIPQEKLYSLQEKSEVCCRLNLPDSETCVQQIQVKIEECKEQIKQAKEFTTFRLEKIMDIANKNYVAP
ncbi:hypothetical protein ACROYT_G032679 [Oculina patagonica]